jgi:hypothetical protein
MKLGKLHFVLENCEVLSVDGKYVLDCSIGGITKNFHAGHHNDTWTSETCSAAFIRLQDPVIENLDDDLRKAGSAYDRLMTHTDVTALVGYDTDGVELFDVYVPWESVTDDDFESVCQFNKVTDDKNVIIQWDIKKNFV